MPTKQKLEWHFNEDENAPTSHWGALPQPATKHEGRQPRPVPLYELLLGFAVLYGVVVYLIWQQTAHHMAVVETELATLRSEIALAQGTDVAKRNAQDADVTVAERPTHVHQFVTAYLRFETSVRAAEAVRAVAQHMDATYQQFYRDFGVPLPAATDKLMIIVDPAVTLNSPTTAEHTLLVPLPVNAAARFGLTLDEALANVLGVQLSQHVLGKAIQARTIKPPWQAMTLALKMYVQLEYGHNKDWRFDPSVLPGRYDAQSRALDFVLSAHSAVTVPSAREIIDSTTTAAAVITASSFVEFMVARDGYAKVPALLDAFAEHEAWDTLAPAVFGISAAELEAHWHAYLHETYPLPERN